MTVALAAGFGIGTAIFSAVRSVLLAPLPYNKPEHLLQIISRWPKTGDNNDWSALLVPSQRGAGTFFLLRSLTLARQCLSRSILWSRCAKSKSIQSICRYCFCSLE